MGSYQEKVIAVLERHFPEFVYSDFDGASYWKSLEEYSTGDTIEHNGKRWRVLYSWAWWKPRGVQVFMAELEPEDVPVSRLT